MKDIQDFALTARLLMIKYTQAAVARLFFRFPFFLHSHAKIILINNASQSKRPNS